MGAVCSETALKLLLILGVVGTIAAVTVTPQFCNFPRYRRRIGIRYECLFQETCYGLRRICRWKCFYYTETYYVRDCCSGYRGQNCDQPICIPSCKNGGVCIAKNTCSCPPDYFGSACTLRGCINDDQDCYPGSCREADKKCICSSGYTGTNCQIMELQPFLQPAAPCIGELRDENKKVIAKANCTEFNPNDTLVIYTREKSFKSIQAIFDHTYEGRGYLPPYPDIGYVRRFNPGLIGSKVQVKLYGTDGIEINLPPEYTHQCESSANSTYGVEAIRCNATFNWPLGIFHNQTLELVLTAETGGSKQILRLTGTNEYTTRQIQGQRASQRIVFKFDTMTPFHCSEFDTCDDKADLPLASLQDHTSNPDVTIQFNGWDDTDSRVLYYKYKVYEMFNNDDGNLTERDTFITQGQFDAFEEVENMKANFKLPRPGLYSIKGEIEDTAGNVRNTRAFVLYLDENQKVEPYDKPWTVSRAVNVVGRTHWMNDSQQSVTVSWKDCYGNRFLQNNELLAPIKGLPGNDDIDYTEGNISTTSIPSINGITKYSWAIINGVRLETENRRKRATNEPQNWNDLTPIQDQITINETRGSGTGFQVWIRAEDPLGNLLTDYINIRTDLSAPDVSGGTFRANVDRPGQEGFFSVVDMIVIDTESDIERIDSKLFDITDTNNPRLIGSATQPGQTTDTSPTECGRTNECECTNQGECYLRPQSVFVNNCIFLKYMNVPVRFEATVYNRALYSKKNTIELQPVSQLSGIGEYPEPKAFRLVQAFPYSVRVTWYPPVACYPIYQYRVELEGKSGSAALSNTTTETEITDLSPNTEYVAIIYVVYENREESARLSFTFSTGAPPENAGLGVGAIVGIVIGVLLIVVLVIVGVLIGLRVKQHKTPLPRRLETVRVDMRDRISRRFGHSIKGEPPPPYSVHGMTLNVAYTSGPKLRNFEDDIYAYGGMETDPEATWKHSDDSVRLGRTIQTGRFAIIREGILIDREGSKKVAVKMLKDHSEEDTMLMKAKMNFMATVVPHHNNIVNFVGAITEGPILLLEYCDMTLKDWLKSLNKLSVEDEDNMTNFCTDIARGMQHLHDNEIIHRRLGARNILLRHLPLMGRMVAKVTGFGPMKGEQKGDAVDSDRERIPIKWMAIEQIGLANKKKPRPYNIKTDVWSYGITVWEIYSKGASPYPDKRLGDIKGLLENGERPECPVDCNDELYDQVMMPCWHKSPSKRPIFSEIRSKLESLFHGAPDGDDYYGTDTDFNPELYDDTLPPKYN